MVQRKVYNTLGIQADHVKAERQHKNLKPACQNQDGKNRGTDLKKKMKKSSRSFKPSPFESLIETPIRKNNTSQPGKPPPLSVKATGATHPRQQSPIRADGSPNYMKSTSCFDARKEKIQVSPINTRTSSDSKSRSRRNSDSSGVGSVSAHKPAKSLTRSPSLKLARALTKTPTFKPVRASVKKSSRVALCADMKAQKATCSSTLKDSKFPAYLILSPGETESEGTSVMKVCPYTYCSLNGHRHSPLPSLKSFLSARRRLLKTQKSIKLESISPIRMKPCCDEMDEKPANSDWGDSAASPLVQEVRSDFLVEMYAKDKEIVGESVVNVEEDHAVFEVNKVEWQDQQFEIDHMDGYPIKVDDDSELSSGCSSENENGGSDDGYLSGSDELLQESYGEILGFEAKFDVGGSEMDGDQDLEMEESSQVSESLCNDQLSFVEYVYENSDRGEEAEMEFIAIVSDSPLTKEISAESAGIDCENQEIEVSEAENVDSEMERKMEATGEASVVLQDDQHLQDDGTRMEIYNESLDFYDIDYDETNEGYGWTQMEDILEFDHNLTSSEFASEQEIHKTGDGVEMEREEEQDIDVASLSEILISDAVEDVNLNEDIADERLAADAQDDLSDGLCKNTNMRENNLSVEERGETKIGMINSKDRIDSEIEETESDENSAPQVEIMKVEDTTKSVKKAEDNSQAPVFSNQEQKDLSSKRNRTIRCKRLIEDSEAQREFNPRDPNYLPLIPDPDKEKVDLRHQIMDDRKNSEEWMLDFALQQTVTKLGPARKKKVALLVEAFETVMPISKCETHLMNASKAFTQAKPIQACF